MSFFRNATILGGAQIVNILLALVSRVVLSRALGAANYGAFGVSTNAIGVTSRVLSLGSASASQYFASKPSVSRSAVVGTSFGLSVLISVFALGGQYLFLSLLQDLLFPKHPSGMQAVLMMSWSMPFVVLAMNLGVMLIPMKKVRAYGILQLLSGGAFVVPCLILLPFLPPLQAAVWAQIVVWASVLGATLWFLRGELRTMRWSNELAIDLLKFGFRSWPNVCLSIGIASFAVLLGARFLTPIELSLFVLAMNIVEGIFAPHGSLGALILSKQASDAAAGDAIMRMMRVSVGLFLCLFVVLAVTGYWLIPLVFGTEFRGAFSVTLALFGTGVSHALLKTMGNAFAGAGRPGLTTGALVVEVVTLVGMLHVLGPMGLWGVVLASVGAATWGVITGLIQMCSLYQARIGDLLLVKKNDWAALRRRSAQLKRAA
ncbi:MAG: lipopolysaccharide biosynthesis protein [Chthonomonas sp.]|nr:lipopolysaccharide biosynthesis protein [Chthonomonas sp.]